ncbi:MAG: C69 family dipeptidase [Oscillospiraceae bacterium]|nr:C69 family dipeptidase [Oscillospiraceae bacterium]
MKALMKKALAVMLAAAMAVSVTMVSASACASIFVGSDLTEDGSTLIARSEDMSNSVDKLFYVSEAGAHAEGDVYYGCYGFVYTFTKDSYSYTAFRDDNGDGVDGVCPDCGSTEEGHVPYEEAGTNEMGLSVTATETLFSNSAIAEVDPLVDDGIAESEMTTILLSECATAREAVELLLSIYDTAGTSEANGLFIADQDEVWYIESVTGHQYVALLLPDDIAFIEPNMSIIGEIDLDDTENVIASEGLIETAVEAGTFIGDEEANIINYRASYSVSIDYPSDFDGYGSAVNERMINGLNYLLGEDVYTEENITDSAFTISNIDEDGNIVALYTNIELTHAYTVDDIVGYFHVDPVGRPSNQETNIFQIFADEEDVALGTIEWVSMANDQYSVFVPCYPMLITDTYAAYQVSTATMEFVTEEPEDGSTYYPYDRTDRSTGETISGFRVLPENWADSYYWCFDAVANFLLYDDATEEDEALVLESYDQLQEAIYIHFAAQQGAIADMDEEEASAYATEDSALMAQSAHELAYALYQAVAMDDTAALDGFDFDF